MPVEYPATLPRPSSYRFRARERRAMSTGDDPQQARTRARDCIVDAQATWRYSPAEMEAWRAWYEGDLLWGQRRFAVLLPGYQGEQLRVARYTSPVQRRHLRAGVWEASADLEILGRAELPEAPGGAAAVIGWHAPIGSASPTAAHENAGSGQFLSAGGSGIGSDLFAGVPGATEDDVVVWSIIWAPLVDLTSDPAPTLLDFSEGRVRVRWTRNPPGSSPYNYAEGSLILTATVNGTPVPGGQRLVAVASNVNYTAVAWGPEP